MPVINVRQPAVLAVDKQGRILLPKLIRDMAGIRKDSRVTVTPVRVQDDVYGLLITQKEGK